MKRTFRYRKDWPLTIEADLNWTVCADGLRITGKTLPGNGFSWGRGITVPEEIDGVPVTEVDTDWRGSLDYIDGPSLKRVTIRISAGPSLFSGEASTLSFSGELYGSPVEALTISSQAPLRLGAASKTLKHLSVTAPDIRFLERGFHGCPVLQTVSFYGPVNADPDWEWTRFDDGLFRNCERLTAVHGEFQGGYSGQECFENCRSLTTAPSVRVQALASGFFRNCEALRDVHLCNGMKRINDSAFQGCRSLEDLYVPDTVTQLGSNVFRDCRGLRSIHLPDRLTEIPDYAFYGCHSLKKVVLSDNLTQIGTGAFADCLSLRDPWIPQKLRSIGTRAFYGCRFTKPIFLPPSVEEVGSQAFGPDPDLCIRGFPGTAAEAFAAREHIRFLPCDR